MAEQCSKAYLAIGLGFNNAMIALLTSINAPIIGHLLNHHSHSQSLTIADYQYAFSFLICMIVLSLILSAFFIKETYCRPTQGFTFIPRARDSSTSKLVAQ